MNKFGYWRNIRPIEDVESGSLWVWINSESMELVDEDVYILGFPSEDEFIPTIKPELPPMLLATHYLRWLDNAMVDDSDPDSEETGEPSIFSIEYMRIDELHRSGMDPISLSAALWESIGKMNELYDNLRHGAQ